MSNLTLILIILVIIAIVLILAMINEAMKDHIDLLVNARWHNYTCADTTPPTTYTDGKRNCTTTERRKKSRSFGD